MVDLLRKEFVDLLFCCVEGQIADIERCRVLQLVLRLRRGAPLVIVTVPSALLLHVLEHVCSSKACVGAPSLWHMSSACPSGRLCSSAPALWSTTPRLYSDDVCDSIGQIFGQTARIVGVVRVSWWRWRELRCSCMCQALHASSFFHGSSHFCLRAAFPRTLFPHASVSQPHRITRGTPKLVNMPKVLSYTPEWLSRPSPGYHLFAPKQSNGNGAAAKSKEFGPRKTIATRGSEVFVAVGHEIRWADLVNLKEGASPAYRTLRVSIPLPITRLTISPGGDYLAVSTSHTVHVVSLPDPSLMESGNDDSPIKPKTFQVGPTAHVLEESPIATVLWHPLGYHGRCLVTITKAGVVRLWEVNRADRSTFSEPTLSIDLVKLANAQKDQDDLGASKYGASKGFSPDSVELEVASACFGDFPEQEGVHGWAPMTLWIATVFGDVYALCPVLPSRWQLVETPGAFTFLQTLTSSININYAELSEDDTFSKEEVKTSEKQISWLSDILYDQEPFTETLPNGDSIKVFDRPRSTPAVPLLQGPLTTTPQVEDFELSDMVVYSLKTFSDGSEEEAAEGLPAAVVCLLTDTCKVHVCIDLEGIVGRWLPSAEVSIQIHDLEILH